MIYLDNSATTRPFDEVIDAMSACMRERYFNASAAYRPAMEAEKEVEYTMSRVLTSLPSWAPT